MEGESKRQQKIQRELQRHLAEIVRGRGMSAFGGALVTVSEVRVSPDFSYAKVFVSIFPTEKKKSVMELIAGESKSIRGELGHVVAKQLRIVPELEFVLDETLDYVQHIDDLLAADRKKSEK
ncbi:MAG: 30S ribosome-binding factor RbfA [Bacteroidales bacterium]|jgi:ribosome-binding factor A|nr:30S ribosome-binding factor RbfA [Bacteroidales bacterium]MCI1732790.1 30S ribosome-binding factor RbfA [Bacteroidales bacterium]